MILKILLGLLGMGIVVFVHELGHFLAARAVGIGVEAFSIGWGRPILKKKIGAVEYRIGMFPLGGYCKMRGENEFQEAWEKRESGGAPPGTYYGVTPLRRIITSLAGPFFNLLFALLVFSIIWGNGFEVSTLENRIVLVSDVQGGETYPADEAGFRSGDRIVKINGRKTAHYHDVQEAIAPNAEQLLAVTVERDGIPVELAVRPRLDRSTGAGRIGVYFWTDPVISAVAPGSAAERAGFLPGDRITRINGVDFPHTMMMLTVMRDSPGVLAIEYERSGEPRAAEIPLAWENGAAEDPGFTWAAINYRTPRLTPWGAAARGALETWKTFALSVKSLSLLFRGVDLTKAVSGPVRITWMVGEQAVSGFGESFGSGISSMASFLALISIALCIMNLLPLPILDGGMIVLFLIEALMRRPLNPRVIYAFQTVGVVLIAGIMLFAVFGDILFLAGR
ncbi:MAG: RIP metalloprotease RseP [Spirochaetaceae bacterium]|jgi:regulator of sigma E protease|nr:RIP metalloprotease RseP [Spirochaetaceae bacterium]